VEDELIQVNMKASELNLAFPNMLNEQFDSFAASVESADAVPTAQQLEVFKMLSGRLDEQIQAYDGILAKDLPAFEELAKSYNITLLYVPKGRR
jgi:triphosphoribosyl-dephospho-CoA synthetase